MLLGGTGMVQHFEPQARTRALAVLEAIASPEAREILKTLARESPLTIQTWRRRDQTG